MLKEGVHVWVHVWLPLWKTLMPSCLARVAKAAREKPSGASVMAHLSLA